jgi:hypothetical protein
MPFWKYAAATVLSTCVLVAQANETNTFTYDALGRLKSVQTSGGPGNGVQRSYQYDDAGNRVQFQITGGASGSPVSISPTSSVVNLVASGGVLAVNLGGSGTPGGMVTFTENGAFLGSAYVFDNQASIFLEGLPRGLHTITASYSGDGANPPYSYTFTIRVQDLSWLPAVMDLLFSN